MHNCSADYLFDHMPPQSKDKIEEGTWEKMNSKLTTVKRSGITQAKPIQSLRSVNDSKAFLVPPCGLVWRIGVAFLSNLHELTLSSSTLSTTMVPNSSALALVVAGCHLSNCQSTAAF